MLHSSFVSHSRKSEKKGSGDNIFLIESRREKYGNESVNNTVLRYMDREDQMPIITVNARLTGSVTLTSQVRSIIRDKYPRKNFQFPWKKNPLMKITYWKNMHDWAVIQYPGSQMGNARQELFVSFPDSSSLEFKASFGKILYPRMSLMHQPTYVYDQW